MQPDLGAPLENRRLLRVFGDGTPSALPSSMDLVFLAIIVVFFAVAIAYVEGCERL